MSRVDPKTLSLDDLRFLVRYHDRAPPVSTYAPCAAECGRGGRGGRVCGECARAELERRGETP